MPSRTTTAQQPRVRLNRTAWIEVCESAGLATDTARADALGTSRVAVNMVQNGHRPPSNEFIARALGYFKAHRIRFEDLFTLETA